MIKVEENYVTEFYYLSLLWRSEHLKVQLCCAFLCGQWYQDKIPPDKGGRKLAFENNIYIKQKVLSSGTVWGDIMGGFCLGGFCPRGDFVQGILSRGVLSGGILS